MKNIKELSLCSLIVCSIFNISCVGDNVGKEASKVLGHAGVKSAKIAADATIGAVKIAADASTKVSENIAKGAQDIGIESAKEIAPYIGAALCLLSVREIVSIGKGLYAYSHPDKERESRIKAAEERIEAIESKRSFRSCLMKNSSTQRGADDLPLACQELGESFAMAAGRAAFHDMAETFKETYPR